MTISTKEINSERLAEALEMLTNNYTRSQENHYDLLNRYGTLLMDYAELKKKYEGTNEI